MGYHETMERSLEDKVEPGEAGFLSLIMSLPIFEDNLVNEMQWAYQSFIRRLVERLETELYKNSPKRVVIYLHASNIEQNLFKDSIIGKTVSAYVFDGEERAVGSDRATAQELVTYIVKSIEFNFAHTSWEVVLEKVADQQSIEIRPELELLN